MLTDADGSATSQKLGAPAPPVDKAKAAQDAPSSYKDTTQPGDLERPTVDRNASWGATKKFLSAYAQTWVGMSPLWLMGEAIVPGQKVGGTFKKGARKLQSAAVEIQQAVSISAQDVVVIIDRQLQDTKAGSSVELTKASEVIKAAGSNALLVVTSSIEKAQQELEAHKELSPEIKKIVTKNSRDVIVLLDKALKHPVVITGCKSFAEKNGIPHADALLRLASMGLGKILTAIPEEAGQSVVTVEELDAAELERQTSKELKAKAEKVGEKGKGPAPKVEDGPADPYEKMRKDSQCVLM
ncbi:hypothetical protein BKA62DRAFT_645170 [Auriculariales sp. MPI-PUGE-AT-0066]|nr:hypothetical protein BKA62DRAFT_645170 [Auriculariales sp. MPI-PUGE-AT-0066]